MTLEQSTRVGSTMKMLLRLDEAGVKKTKMGVAFCTIAGMPGIDGECIARVCGTKKRTGFANADKLVDLGLVEKRPIFKFETVRGRRRAGFYLTQKGLNLIK